MGSIELVKPVDIARERLRSAMETGSTILQEVPTTNVGLETFRERYLAWESRTSAVLESLFKTSGLMTSSPRDEFSGTAISLLDLKLASTTIPLERIGEVESDIREKLRVLRSIEDRLDLYEITDRPVTTGSMTRPEAEVNGPIFLVHGRDIERREIVRRFLERVTGNNVVVLAEQPNQGRDLLGKLLNHAQPASFAVVLLTPDDVGGRDPDDLKARARQNVVFELGLFIAMLGRSKVAALNDSTVELPTDFSGVAYISLTSDSWQVELARELKAAGLSVSLDNIL